MGCDEFDSVLSKLVVQLTRVVSVVTNQILWCLRHNHLDESGGSESHFMRSGAIHTYRNWQPVAICNCHNLCSFATLRLSDLRAPFLAGAKLPSIKASCTSRSLRLLSSRAKASRTPLITPERTHC